jgi:hypothetical protein
MCGVFFSAHRLYRDRNQHEIRGYDASIFIILFKNIKIIYLTHRISVFNFIFTIVFYKTIRTKLDLTGIYFNNF